MNGGSAKAIRTTIDEANLPPVYKKTVGGEVRYGFELNRAQLKKLKSKGVDIEPHEQFRVMTKQRTLSNHYSEAKDLYYRFGMRGVNEYVRAIRQISKDVEELSFLQRVELYFKRLFFQIKSELR